MIFICHPASTVIPNEVRDLFFQPQQEQKQIPHFVRNDNF